MEIPDREGILREISKVEKQLADLRDLLCEDHEKYISLPLGCLDLA